MKRRISVALCLAAVGAAAVVAGTSAATKKATANSITVWLQVDAQSGWPKVVAAANKLHRPLADITTRLRSMGYPVPDFDIRLPRSRPGGA